MTQMYVLYKPAEDEEGLFLRPTTGIFANSAIEALQIAKKARHVAPIIGPADATDILHLSKRRTLS